MLQSQPPELGESKFLLFRPSTLWHFVTAALGNWYTLTVYTSASEELMRIKMRSVPWYGTGTFKKIQMQKFSLGGRTRHSKKRTIGSNYSMQNSSKSQMPRNTGIRMIHKVTSGFPIWQSGSGSQDPGIQLLIPGWDWWGPSVSSRGTRATQLDSATSIQGRGSSNQN